MTYRIEFQKEDGRWTPVFDIDFWMTHSDVKRDAWYSEISAGVCPEGMVLLGRTIDDERLKEFIEESEYIAELRCELYEGGALWRNLISHNNPTIQEEASQRHYHELRPVIEKRLKDYCEKYNCSLAID